MSYSHAHDGDLISRSALLETITACYEDAKAYDSNMREILQKHCYYAHDLVEEAPAVDAVEVVRCKDCKAWGKSPWGHFPKGWCKIHGRHRDPEYYCASGVRKDEVDT